MGKKEKGIYFCCEEHSTISLLPQYAEKQFKFLILGDDEYVNREGENIAIEVQDDKSHEVVVKECSSMGLFEITEIFKS